MQQVLIIGHVWPEPNSSAAGARMLQLIESFLHADAQITFACAAAISPHRADLDHLGVRSVSIELNNSSFDRFIAQLQPTMVMFDRFMVEEQFGWRVAEQCPDTLRILDTEDLHCLRDARHRALKADEEADANYLNSELAMREVAAIYRCDSTLMISQAEIDLLTEHYRVPPELLFHLPFMLPKVQTAHWPAYTQRSGYISIGNFRHAPNWDAVRYLKQTVWPLIRALQPEAQLSVYGAYPPPKAMQLHKPQAGFHIKGWADDAHQVMQQARVCLAPLRFGAGLKGKLIDAMLAGTPSVTTPIGAEGMAPSHPWPGHICNTPEAIAECAVELHQHSERWYAAQQHAQPLIDSLYGQKRHRERFHTHLRDLQQQLNKRRLNNFHGAMLRHHHLQSTRYMAQWIEAKNLLTSAPADCAKTSE